MANIRVIGAASMQQAVLGQESSPDRLDFYAKVMGILPAEVAGAEVYDLGSGGPEAVALARSVMATMGQVAPETVRARLGALRVAAASRVRAARAAARGLRIGVGEVTVHSARQSHAGFFGLEVMTLSHRRFDGSTSPQIIREVFVSGDAVTVLPYDPVRDRVLLIEQLRAGPLGRGDPLPWQLEAVAGRIDPGETPEDCARREAVEEAGLSLGRLLKVGEYYSSPGAMTEYSYSYVGLCDLPDGVAGVFGQADEAEDIRGHLLSFAAFMTAVDAGEVANAPLLLTALWLQRERGRLRG
ncbi:MAG: tellurium resistance protein [Rhodobacter sp.]|nr:tellurium resistance protein [Rhodobacter sp.]